MSWNASDRTLIFHFIISHCGRWYCASSSLTRSQPAQCVLSALICEPESRSAGIVGNFFCLSLQFLLFAKAKARTVEGGGRENICVQTWYTFMCIRRANEISTLIGTPSYFINANVKGRTRVHGRKWEAHASEQPSTVRRFWLMSSRAFHVGGMETINDRFNEATQYAVRKVITRLNLTLSRCFGSTCCWTWKLGKFLESWLRGRL